MKMLFFIHALSGGGSERVMATLINKLDEQGHDIYLATDLSIDFAYYVSPRVCLINLKKNFPKVSKMSVNKIYRRIWVIRNIRKIALGIKPEVVVSFNTELNCKVIMALLGTGIPVICSEHNNMERDIPMSVRLPMTLLYPFANAVTLLTRYDYNIWKNKYSNVVYMPNPIELSEKNRCNNREPVVLIAGSLTRWHQKGFDNIIKCWGELCKKHPDWILKIAGGYDNVSYDYIMSLIERYKCTNIDILGFRSDIKELMKSCSIFCLPSRYEGLPMVLLEAMNCGACCIAYDCKTGPREVIKHDVSGILVDNQDHQSMTDSLSELMYNKSIREKIAANSFKTISNYSVDRIILRWNILINKVTTKHV